MTGVDANSILFLEDFMIYLNEQYMMLLSNSAVFLKLYHNIASCNFQEKQIETFRNSLYRNDDVAISSLAQFLVKCISRNSDLLALKPFAESLIQRYLKWTLSSDAKTTVLELIVEMCHKRLLDHKAIWKVILDPKPSFLEKNSDLCFRLLKFLPAVLYIGVLLLLNFRMN
jgi:hypothetical protein